jgi:foldase protein PrsA
MMALRHISLTCVLAAALAPAVARCAVPEGAVAVVNGEAIGRAEFERSLVQVLGRATIDRFLDWVLVEQEAKRKGVTVTDQELEARRQFEIRARLRKAYETARMAPEEFKSVTSSYGWDEETTRREIEESIAPRALRIRLLTEKLLRPYMETSDQDVRRHYDWLMGDRLVVAHIAVRDQATARKLMDALQKAPEGWTQAVLQYTLDRESVPYKGRLRPFPASSKLGPVVENMKLGEMKLYGDGDTWHILRFICRIPAAKESFEQTKEEVKNDLYCRRVEELTEMWLGRLHLGSTIVPNVSADPAVRQVMGDDVAAFVNGEPVAVTEFGRALAEEFGKRVIGSYIERQLLLQEARRLGVGVSDGDVQARRAALAEAAFAERAAEAAADPTEFGRLLTQRGISPAQYKEQIALEYIPPENVRALLLAEKMVAGDVQVTDEDVQRAYDDFYGDQFAVRCIVTDTARQAEEARQKALNGASFLLLVETESVEPLAWMDGGLLTGITARHPYYGHVKDLREGQLSPVFERNGKFHVLKVVGRQKPQDPAPPLQQVRDRMLSRALKLKTLGRIQAWLLKLKAEARVEVAI